MGIPKINGVSNAAQDDSEQLFRVLHLRRPDRDGAAEQSAEPSKAAPGDLDEAVSDVRIFLKTLNTELRFEVDRELKEVLVRIVDPATGEVIRQIPSEEFIAIRKRMEELVGVLYRTKT